MGLSSALATAMSGLRANQAALSIVSGNIANAQTPGYVTQLPTRSKSATGATGTSVDVTGVSRQLDLYVQSQLRTETSGSGYADQMSNILGQLQNVYGTPGGAGTLETPLQQLHQRAAGAVDQPRAAKSAQTAALGAAQALAQTAERDDAGHPDAAHQRQSGYRQFGEPGQRRHEHRSPPSMASCRDWRRPIRRPPRWRTSATMRSTICRN